MTTTTPSLQVTGAFAGGVNALSAASSVSLDCNTGNCFTLTVNQSCTITPSYGIAGQSIFIIIATSGTTSRTITFASPFKTSGTLSTGTSSGKKFVISFVFDGTNYIEKSRTTAL